jgi:RHS repeat-associated protein
MAGMTNTRRYDSLGQVISGKKFWPDTTEVDGQQFGYDFDDIGNRVSTDTNGRPASYSPNNLNQYTERTVPGAVDVIGSSEPEATVTVNNMATQRKCDYFHKELPVLNLATDQYPAISVVGVRKNAGPGGTDIVTEETGHAFVPKTPEIFEHDPDGNLTQDGRWIYTWDAENRLIAMETVSGLRSTVPGRRLEFAYDHQSRRISKKVYEWNVESSVFSLQSSVVFVYDGWNLMAELTEVSGQMSVVRSHVWGLDLSGTEQGAGGDGGLLFTTSHLPLASSHFACFDGNGNVSALVDTATGNLAATYEYDPFGNLIARIENPASSIQNPFLFSTKYTDTETGLYYYGYRYYQPSTGRWLNRDPIGEEGGIPLYGVIGNDLIDGGDYLGLEVLTHATQIAETAAQIFEEGLKPGIEVGGRWPNIWMSGEGAFVPPNGVNLLYDMNVSSVKEVPCNVVEQALKAGEAVKSGPGRGNAIWKVINDWIQSQPDGAWMVPVDKAGRLAEVGKGEGYHYAFRSGNAWRLFKPEFLKVTGARSVKIPKYTKVGGKVLVALGIAMDIYEISTAEDTARTIVSVYYGWTGAIVGAKAGAALGALIGAGIGVWVFGAGVVPGAGIGGAVVGIAGGVGGYFGGRRVGEIVYDSIIESGFTYY